MSSPTSPIAFLLVEVVTSGTFAEYQQHEDPTTEDFEEEIDFYVSERTDTLTLSSDGSEADLSVTVDDLEEWPEQLATSDEEGKDGKRNNGAKSGVEEPLQGPMKSSEEGSRSELHSNDGAVVDEPGDAAQGAPKEGKKWSILPGSVKKLFARKSESTKGSPTGSTGPAAFAPIVPEQPLEPEQQRRRRGEKAWAAESGRDRLRHEGAAGAARSDEPQHVDAPTGRGSQGTGSGSSTSSTFSFPRFGRSRSAQVVPLEA